MKNFAELTEKIIALNSEELSENMGLLDRCLDELEKKKDSFKQPKKKFFNFGAPAVNWIEGSGVGNCGSVLTKYLSDKNLPHYEMRAAQVWVTAVLAVNAHYRHMVGPAMVANIKVEDKLGATDRALQLCGAVVADFSSELKMCEEFDSRPEPGEEDYDSIKSLEFVVDRLLVNDKSSSDLLSLKSRIEAVWAKPKYVEDGT